MALAVAEASSAVVCALPSGNSSVARWRSASESSRIGGSGCGRSARISARLAVEKRSSFLRDCSFESFIELGLSKDDYCVASDGQGRNRAQCFAGLRGRSSNGGGRLFYFPFGREGGRGGGRGTFPGREWERRQQTQQHRLREIVEQEMKARSDVENNKTSCYKTEKRSYEFALLRELEKRLRYEENAGRKEENGDENVQGQSVRGEEEASSTKEDNGGNENAQGESVQGEEQATTAISGASTYELMKELEMRLRAERESQRGSGERRRSERDGRVLQSGNYSSLYEYMRAWDREMREQRTRLEELWESREDSRVAEKRRWSRDYARGGYGRRKGKMAVDESETSAAPETGPTPPMYSQSNSTVVYLKNEANGAEIYLVGTSHVSQKSAEEVREVIERVKPDVVMVELCRKRYESMQRYADQDKTQRDNPIAFVEQMVKLLTNGNVGPVGKFVGVGLASFYRLLSYRGFHPGKEFQVAIEEGKKVGAQIVLGDRDIDITLQHLGNFNLNMSMLDTFKFLGQRMPDDVAQSIGGKGASQDDMFERMRDRKVVRRFNEEMDKRAPVIYKALLSERNEVMVRALRNLKGKVVVVVGLAHLDGMEQLWQQANEKYVAEQSK